MNSGLWTIEELAEHVADALAAGDPAQPSGRVREVPDRRTIRWYTTIGLVDRPAMMRGRTALYGWRHLLQLVTVKRLQAAGRSLASIQEELLGASDAALERIAALPGSAAAPPAPTPPAPSVPAPGAAVPAGPARARFWSAPPPAVPPAADGHAGPAPLDGRASVVPAIRLGDGATLLLDTASRALTADELAAINAAAAPLLDLLRQLDLTKG
jgi:hypothetical protein